MLVIAHRGIVTEWPEDSLEAIRAVVDSAAEGVEFDVHRSADGTWWLFHDHTLDDRTAGTGFFWEATDATLSGLAYEGGLGYDAARHADLVPLARLDDVLEALAGYPGVVIVDAKDPRPGTAGELAHLLSSRGLYPIVTAQSAEAAAEIEAADSRFTTMLPSPGFNLGADLWIADPAMSSPLIDLAHDLLGDFGTYVPEPSLSDMDQEAVLRAARERNCWFVIVNDVDAALAWRAAMDR